MIMLISGIVFFFLSIDYANWSWRSLWAFFAELLIVGVLFSFIANAGLFSNVFNRELQNIIYGNKFIGKRADLEIVWGNLSQKLCGDKFKNISIDLLNTIKSYFPTDAVSYFDNYNIELKVEWIDKRSGQIRVTQDIHTQIIAETPERFPSPFKSTTPKGCDCKVRVIELTVNGKSVKQDTIKEQNGNGETIHRHDLEFEGKLQYDVNFIRERTYSVYKDNFIGFQASHIINRMSVRLTLPEGITADFLSRGTLGDFSNVRQTINSFEKRYDGIILPNQGYIIILKTKKK